MAEAAQLEEAVRIAEKAATAAGETLRRAFGGPLQCRQDADVRAESLIRRLLQDFDPTFGFVGEETGIDLSTNGHLCWHVDPNDGTRAYLLGYRDCSVSIGLVCDGTPVAGVVYAPLDVSDGELFSWAKGQPLRRNHIEIASRRLPQELTKHHRVLVSYDADQSPEAFSAGCAPARYHKVSSIALRLARVASGEGEAAVGNYAPSSWDVAAGHALLLGMETELLDERGQPVRYRCGQPVAERVFAASDRVAAILRARQWRNLPPESSGALGDIIGPDANHSFPDIACLNRAAGCLLGFLIGDWLSTWLGRHPEDDRLRWCPGQVSAWSELLWLLARHVVQPDPTPRAWLADDVRAWMNTRPPIRINDRIQTFSEETLSIGLRVATSVVSAIVQAGARTTVDKCDALAYAITELLATGEPTANTERNDRAKPLDYRFSTDAPAFYRMIHDTTGDNTALRNIISLIFRECRNTSLAIAVTGAIIGASSGLCAMPLFATRLIESARPLSGGTDVEYARPRGVWTINFTQLAERLLTVRSPTCIGR